MYVNDLLKSFETEKEAKGMVNELICLRSMAGFSLLKWTSNSKEVLHSIPKEHWAPAVRNLAIGDQLPCEKTLGLLCDAEADDFQFSIQLKPHPSTKRGILSTISSVFDPLGLVAPITLEPKQLLQKLS